VKTRREKEAVFSKLDMLRFARFLVGHSETEQGIQERFSSRVNGSNGERRYRWIKKD